MFPARLRTRATTEGLPRNADLFEAGCRSTRSSFGRKPSAVIRIDPAIRAQRRRRSNGALMPAMPDTARSLGVVNAYDPEENIAAAPPIADAY